MQPQRTRHTTKGQAMDAMDPSASASASAFEFASAFAFASASFPWTLDPPGRGRLVFAW